MANMKEILPKGDYKVKVVGPSRDWEINGTPMKTDSIQFEGYEQYWIDVNRAANKNAPNPGDTLNGHVEQDENAKYPPKFKKESGGGNWSGNSNGGAKASPGAIQAQNVVTAVQIVNGFYTLTGKKPNDFDAYMKKIEGVAPSVGKMVDRLVGAQPAAAAPAATNSEAGETAAPAAAPVQTAAPVEDISDEDLGDW